MKNRSKYSIGVTGIITAIFLVFGALEVKSVFIPQINLPIICSFSGPENSPDLLRLTGFLVTGPSNPKVGDSITVSFKLQNNGQNDLNLGSKGVFVNARNPDNSDVSFGLTRQNTTFKLEETISVSSTKVLDKAGTWKIWPSYHLSFVGAPEKFGPNEWHVCTINVLPKIQDSDNDGLEDDKDNCPLKYNPKQEDIDADGIGDVCDSCDDRDSDQDKIKNCLDKCPDKPETYNGYEDNDGCPDEKPLEVKDSDGDGILDNKDKCPNEKETFNNYQDDDGCPDEKLEETKDTDGDGIPDIKDKCPKEKEIFNNYQDDDGCPDEKPKEKIKPPKEKISSFINVFTNPPSAHPGEEVTFTANASDTSGVEKIEIFVNNELKKSCSRKCTPSEITLGQCSPLEQTKTEEWSCSFNTNLYSTGEITYFARVVNSLGESSESAKRGMQTSVEGFSQSSIIHSVSGSIEDFYYSPERIKIKVCPAERVCSFNLFGKKWLCSTHCKPEGLTQYADVSRGGWYSISLASGQYILKPIYQPIGECHWKSWEPEEQSVLVGNDDIEGLNFKYVPLGDQIPKVDLLILGPPDERGSIISFYTDEERVRLEEKIREYQLVLANEGLCSYFGHLSEGENRDTLNLIGTSRIYSWWDNAEIWGIVYQLIRRLNVSYLLILGHPDYFPSQTIPYESDEGKVYGLYTDDLYGDINGDNLLDIPVGRIPVLKEDINVLINYFDTVLQIHRNDGLDLSNYQSLFMDGGWNASLCINRDVFRRSCGNDPHCKNNNLDCTLSEANSKGFFFLLLHGNDDPLQKFSTNNQDEGGIGKCYGWGEGKGFTASDLSLLNIRNSLWMAMPCFSGYITNKEHTIQSIPMTFFKNGGAVYIGDTDIGYGSHGCPNGTFNCKRCLNPSCDSCSNEEIGGDACSGTLFTEIAQRFNKDKRIGDAFLEGKNYYYKNYNCPWEGKDYIYHIAHLYGDPTLKIQKKW